MSAPGSTTHSKIRTPLAFRPLNKRGGVRNQERISPTVQMSAPGSMAMETIPDPPPPRLSTFKSRGGVRNCGCSFQRPQSQRPNQRHSCSPAPLSCPELSQCGTSSRHITFRPPTFPCCHMSLIHPSSLTHVASPSVHHPLIACHASLSFHIRLSPEGESVSPVFVPSTWLSLSTDHPLFSPFLSSLSLLVINPTTHCVLCDGPHTRPSGHSVVPGGIARSIHYLEMLSWLGRYRSQEAVIEAVGGG
jgi:hypothetical protein